MTTWKLTAAVTTMAIVLGCLGYPLGVATRSLPFMGAFAIMLVGLAVAGAAALAVSTIRIPQPEVIVS